MTVPGKLSPDGELLLAGEHSEPHRYLGVHPVADAAGRQGLVLRCMHPDAVSAQCVLEDRSLQMRALGGGLFEIAIAGAKLPLSYRFRYHFSDGSEHELEDPYRFLPTLGELDLHLFHEGRHLAPWECMGARVMELDGVQGTAFSVWAPNARRVSVVGDFCNWDGRRYPMRVLGFSGVFELFVPGIEAGALYKFEIAGASAEVQLKSDPFARKLEQAPGTASIVVGASQHEWRDAAWIAKRSNIDHVRAPLSVYEMHLGSWARADSGNRPLSYREIAPRLVEHVLSLGHTHVEFMPIAEHPFTGSWGYQVTGFYAPTSRYGSPDDLRFLIDACHQAGIGVLLDWVAAHFPRDDHALRRFDGTALYEHDDPRLGEHPDWGTQIFNFGRSEVRGFLAGSALYWLREFHFDGLRVDAVASMLYLDYSRSAGAWLRNRHGGRENLEAIAFIRALNDMVATECPGCMMIAEESTAWPGVTQPVEQGGLGFTFKWNMGWMHDSLRYFGRELAQRPFHQDELSFAMLYEYSERFMMPLSHDEVVHMKGSLLSRMPGDQWQRFANLRTMLAYMFTRPGKKLLFMGAELAPWSEWNHDAGLEWHLLDTEPHRRHLHFSRALGRLYREHAALWEADHDPEGYSWIDANDRDNCVIAYVRRGGDEELLVILNLTAQPHPKYRVGSPSQGSYRVIFSSDDSQFGGSGYPIAPYFESEPVHFHGFPQSLHLTLPPLAALVLMRAPDAS